MSCNHKWVYMEDGSGDKGCYKCGSIQIGKRNANKSSK